VTHPLSLARLVAFTAVNTSLICTGLAPAASALPLTQYQQRLLADTPTGGGWSAQPMTATTAPETRPVAPPARIPATGAPAPAGPLTVQAPGALPPLVRDPAAARQTPHASTFSRTSPGPAAGGEVLGDA